MTLGAKAALGHNKKGGVMSNNFLYIGWAAIRVRVPQPAGAGVPSESEPPTRRRRAGRLDRYEVNGSSYSEAPFRAPAFS